MPGTVTSMETSPLKTPHNNVLPMNNLYVLYEGKRIYYRKFGKKENHRKQNHSPSYHAKIKHKSFAPRLMFYGLFLLYKMSLEGYAVYLVACTF